MMQPWRGVLFYIGEASQQPIQLMPQSRGRGYDPRPALVTLAAAEKFVTLLPGAWIGMGHSFQRIHSKVGSVTSAYIEDDAVVVRGYAERYSDDSRNAPGLSFEATGCLPVDLCGPCWELIDVREVQGVAIARKPAFRSSFEWEAPL